MPSRIAETVVGANIERNDFQDVKYSIQQSDAADAVSSCRRNGNDISQRCDCHRMYRKSVHSLLAKPDALFQTDCSVRRTAQSETVKLRLPDLDLLQKRCDRSAPVLRWKESILGEAIGLLQA